MLQEIWQEITELRQDQKFVRNLGLVGVATLISSCSLAIGNVSPERLTQQEKLDQFSELVSVGLCIRTQTILGK